MASEDTVRSAVFRAASPASRRIARYRADEIRYCTTTDDAHRSAVLPLKTFRNMCASFNILQPCRHFRREELIRRYEHAHPQ